MGRWKEARWPYLAFVLIEVVIFGSGSAVTKFAYESISPLWCLAVRFGLATLVFALFFGRRMYRRLRTARVRAWLPAALGMAISYLCCNVALDLTTATNVGFLVALPVVFAPLLSAVVGRTRYPRALIPFQGAVAAGLYLLCSQGGSLSVGAGELMALGSSVALAVALVFGKEALAELDAVTVAGTQIAVAFLLCLGCAIVLEPPVNLAAVQPVAWGIILFLALLSTCLTFFLQSVALDRLSSTTVSLLLTGEPVFTALFAYWWLGETLSATGFVGAVLIVATVIAATYVDGRADAPVAPAAPATAAAQRTPSAVAVSGGTIAPGALAPVSVPAVAAVPGPAAPRVAFGFRAGSHYGRRLGLGSWVLARTGRGEDSLAA